MTSPTNAGEWPYDPIDIKWFADGALNLRRNAIDRHLTQRGDDNAIMFEPDDLDMAGRTLIYRDLHREAVAMANVLKGDRRDEGRSGSRFRCR